MKIIEILGEDREPEYTRLAEGCRGIIIRDGKILLSFYRKQDQYLIPGGGIESGESLAECCKRELAEECGVVVDPHTHYLTLEEYYHEYYFKSHYFLCDHMGECETSFTENEKKNGLEPRWINLDEALGIFGSYESYKNKDEIRYGTYYREWIALNEVNMLEKKSNEN